MAIRGGRVVEDEVEVATGQLPLGGCGAVEAQQALRGEDDQRPRLADQRLAAQQVEILGRGGRVGDPDVALGAERQEALDAGAGVLRPRTLVAVRQQQGEAAGLSPLGLAGGDEAVDDHLAGVGEVAVLRLPEDEGVWGGGRVAVLEAEAGHLREGAVVELERGGGVIEVLHRAVLEPGVLVVEDEMAVGEGAALGVLAGEADVDAVGEQRGEGERLGVAELDPAARQRLDPPGERLAQLAVDREALRRLDQRLVQLAQPLGRDRSLHRRAGAAIQLAGAGRGQGRVLVLAQLHPAAQVLQRRRHLVVAPLRGALDVLGGDDSLGDQLPGVDLGDRRVRLDLRRGQRLGVGGLVGLAVAAAAVADRVDDYVAAPALAVGHREADRRRAGLDVVAVDVDDRDVEALRHVGRVGGGAGFVRVGGEAHLVVLDDVDGAAGRVSLQRLQVEGFGHDALAGEGGVAVQQHRDGALRVVAQVRPFEVGLDEAGGAGDHRVDELEVAGVGVEAGCDLLALAGLVDPLVAVVVLDVAGAAVGDRGDRLHRLDPLRPLELGQDRLDRAAEVVGEDAEPAAVRHPEDDLLGAAPVGEGDQLVEHRHDRVEPLDREDLLAEIGPLDEALELEDVDQALQQAAFLLIGERLAVGAGLDHLPQPGPLPVGGEVLELVGDRAAVGLAHPGQRLEQGLPGDADAEDRGGDPGHQLRGQVEVLGLDRGVALRLAAERVEAGGEVAVGAVALEQGGRGLDRLQELLVGLGGGRGRGGGAERRRRGGGRVGGGERRRVDAEVGGERLVEAVLALEQLFDPAQEGARLGALDDAVVVGRGQRHRLRDAELAQPLGRRVRPLGRVGDRAGRDDRALAAGQAGDRGDGAEAAGVGEGDVGPLEVVGGELALPRLGDQILVAGVEGGEVEPVGALDRGDHEAVGAVLALDVDRDAEVDRGRLDRERLAVALLEDAGHHRPLLRRLHDRPGDQVGEGDLHAALPEDAVQRLALGVQRVDRDRAEGGGGGHRAALVHRRGEHRRGAAQRLRLALGRSGRSSVDRRQDILLGHLVAGARPLDGAQIDAGLFRDAPRNGRCLDLIGSDTVGPGGGSPARLRVACGFRPRRLFRRGRFPRDRTRSRSVRALGRAAALARLHLRQGRPDRDLLVDLGDQAGDHAVGGGRHLGVDLVG